MSNHWGSDLGRLLSNRDAAGQVASEFSAMLGAQVQPAPIYQQRPEERAALLRHRDEHADEVGPE